MSLCALVKHSIWSRVCQQHLPLNMIVRSCSRSCRWDVVLLPLSVFGFVACSLGMLPLADTRQACLVNKSVFVGFLSIEEELSLICRIMLFPTARIC